MYDDKIMRVSDYSYSRVRPFAIAHRARSCENCHHRKRAKKWRPLRPYNLWDNHRYSIANFNFN